MINPLRAGVWGSDPVIGVTGDYATDPTLVDASHTSAVDAALLVDAPTTYEDENVKFSLLPSFRLSSTSGYASVLSDYAHLNAKAEYDTERSTLTATVGVARDSNLYFNYLSDGTIGVRRDSAQTDLYFDRLLTENVEFNTDLDATRVRYGESNVVNTLVDYRYLSLSPSLTWNAGERNKYTVSTSVGRYNSLNGATESRSASMQLGFVRQLSEQWTFTAMGGYSRALNRIEADQEIIVFTSKGPVIEFVPVRVESAQNGSVYSLDLSHQGERLLLSATASRQVAPTGFAFLSRQQAYELKSTFILSPRWSVSADLRQVNYVNPVGNGRFYTVKVPYASLSAYWQMTEHWTLSASTSHIRETVPASTFNEHSQELSLTLSRKFNHINFQ